MSALDHGDGAAVTDVDSEQAELEFVVIEQWIEHSARVDIPLWCRHEFLPQIIALSFGAEIGSDGFC
jgi:hypothetical protein